MHSRDAECLYEVAEASIEHGLQHGVPLEPRSDEGSAALRTPGASFVTLRCAGELRGCIGTLEASRPLVVDVAHNAFAAAFLDPRFAPLASAQWAELDLQISVLSPAEPIQAPSEAHLIASIRPGRDGLILEWARRRATFLPAVWEQLPEPGDFLRALKAKAGLPDDFWSSELRFLRYRADSLSRPPRALAESLQVPERTDV